MKLQKKSLKNLQNLSVDNTKGDESKCQGKNQTITK